MSKKKKIVIAEDHTIIREGLRSILSANDEYEIIGEAEDGLQAIQAIERLQPDLILMDLSMPRMNGLEAIMDIKSRYPQVKVLVLTVHKTEEHVIAAFNAGADGYLLKYSGKPELLMAIKSVLRGESYISPKISDQVLEGFLEGSKTVKKVSAWDTLTARERQVLKLVGEGYKNKEISDYLCISVKTVETHRSSIMKKLDLHSAAELAAYAVQKGLVTK